MRKSSERRIFVIILYMDLTEKSLKLTPLQYKTLTALGLNNSKEVLSYYPFRYEIMEETPYANWKVKDKVTIEGIVVKVPSLYRFGRKKSVIRFDVMAYDRVFHISLFNRPWAKQLQIEDKVTISGIYMGKDNITAISYIAKPLNDIPKITPVYSLKKDMKQKTIRDSIKKVYQNSINEIQEEVPYSFLDKYQLEHHKDALRKVHFPESKEEVQRGIRTLKYEEFLQFFLSIQYMRSQNGEDLIKEPKRFDTKAIDTLLGNLEFTPTEDQVKAIQDILKDLSSNKPMYRIVQGDVGCGKTLVAAVGLYATFLAGYQSAFLAPTEILARQHYASLKVIFKDVNIKIGLLYSGEKNDEKGRVLKALEKGEIDILVGTHSIIQEGVFYHNLGFVVVDEQQRFGVEQRRALREKGEKVDFLLMSATPIPRTLASTLYGDMDISTIETMPVGRKQVITKLIKENSFRSVLNDVFDLLKSGRQLYVICAAVEESEDYEARNVIDTANTLSKLFKEVGKVGVLHGRLSSEEKSLVMKKFEKNEIQVLVSTTVVEVGVNVVNATGMIIYDADRFGMSQIHQLRGRIQRGPSQGYCWLLTDSMDENSLERLEILEKTTNGFEISYQDLRLRGPGDILGTRQSGVPDFILGNIVEDTKMIETAKKDAKEIFEHPEIDENAWMIEKIKNKNKHNISYVD